MAGQADGCVWSDNRLSRIAVATAKNISVQSQHLDRHQPSQPRNGGGIHGTAPVTRALIVHDTAILDMTNDDRIIAVGLLTQQDLDVLGTGFRRVYPVDKVKCFGDLLRDIDDADHNMRMGRDQSLHRAAGD